MVPASLTYHSIRRAILTNTEKVDYKSAHAEDSKLGRLFSIELDMYNESGTLENSFQFNVFILWGASKVGEQYNGSRVLTWFKNYPFSVGLYSATSGNVKVTIDGSESSPIALSGQNAWNYHSCWN